MAENPRIEELRRRVQADPASIVFAALAEEFRRVGRYEEAVETCQTGLQRHPAYLSARVTLGRALIETGDFEGAREQLETVLRSAPENLAAIRGLAQINERLGHSTELDPHLADMMTTHAESIRVASLTPPAPAPPALPALSSVEGSSVEGSPVEGPAPALEPIVLSLEPEPAPEPGPDFSMAPEPAAQAAPVDTGPSIDPFAGFAPISKPAAAPDFSFDLAPAPPIDLPIAAVAEPEPALDLVIEESAEPAFEAGPVIVQERQFEPAPEPEPEPYQEPEPEPVMQLQQGPDPAVLATLARLERFLDAIHSLRA